LPGISCFDPLDPVTEKFTQIIDQATRVPELLLADIENSVNVPFSTDHKEGIVGAFGDENIANVSDEGGPLNRNGLHEVGASENCDSGHSLNRDTPKFVLALLIPLCGEMNLGALQISENGASCGLA
jgi:hypothetical protein